MAGQDEFPGLAFGIKDMDQRQKFSSANSSQDFPSLGSAAGVAGGPKPAGVWGRGAGRLAGECDFDDPRRSTCLISVLVSLSHTHLTQTSACTREAVCCICLVLQ